MQRRPRALLGCLMNALDGGVFASARAEPVLQEAGGVVGAQRSRESVIGLNSLSLPLLDPLVRSARFGLLPVDPTPAV